MLASGPFAMGPSMGTQARARVLCNEGFLPIFLTPYSKPWFKKHDIHRSGYPG